MFQRYRGCHSVATARARDFAVLLKKRTRLPLLGDLGSARACLTRRSLGEGGATWRAGLASRELLRKFLGDEDTPCKR